MKKKIIGIAVFLFAALFMFTFANPASETEEKMDNNITTNDKKNVEENKNTEIKTEEKVENQTVNNNLRRVNVSNKVNTINNVKKEENSNVLEPFAPVGIDLDTVKKNAIKELENYLDKENYRENEQKEIDKIIDEAKEKIDNATTIEEINKIKEDTKQELDNVKTNEELTKVEELEKAKEEAKNELENYLDKENYRENEQKEIDKIIDEAKEKIDNATTIEEINKIKEDTKQELDKVKTNEELTKAEELEKAKEEAKNELKNYLDKENYRENEQKEIDKIIDAAKEKIDNATTIEEINKIKEDTKQELDKVKTDKELTQEELEKAKTEAIANLKKYRDDNLSGNYFDEGTKVLAEATTKINSATTKENVTKLYNDYLKQLKELKEMQDYQKSSKFNITFGQYETNGACVKKIAGVCVKHEKVMKPNTSISKKNNTKVALIFPQIHNVTIKYDGKVVEMPLYSNIKHTDISNVKYITLEYMILGDKIFCGSYVETYEIKFDVNGNRYVQLISSVKK